MFTGADAYDRHVGRYSGALAQALIEKAGIAEGDRVLDVGCGPGALTQALAGAGATVAAIDPSDPFAHACRARVPESDVRVASAEAIPFADDSFDAALSQLVVNFMADAPAGVREMSRVVRPGGVVAAAVWDYAAGMKLLRVFWDAAIATDSDAAELDEGRSMRWCSEAELEGLWSGTGLEGVETGQLEVEAAYERYEDLWAPLEAGVGPSGAYVAALEPDRQQRLREELRTRLGAGDEPFTLSARAFYALGRVA